MNPTRVAALFRELAEEFDLQEESDNGAIAAKSATGMPERRSNAAESAAPKRPITDIEKAQARRALRRLGLPV